MKKRLLDDAIIFNGEVYELVECTLDDECERCDLQGFCKENCGNYLCGTLHEYNQRIYQKAGTIEEILERYEKRKLARHYIAVLTQQKRYYDAALHKDVDIYKLPKASETVKAVEFLIKELKEVFK